MGLLIDGSWSTAWYDTEKTDGKFVREDAGFRHWITADGAAGPTGKAGFKAESGRYHLYVSHACPWAHRTTQDHGQLPKAYLKSCEKFFRELGIKAASNELQAASFKRQAASDKLDNKK